jgi:type IV pilus assembly protein PilZ
MTQVRVVAAEAASKSERRRSERTDCVVSVSYSSVDELFTEFTRDINEGGLFIETNLPLDSGTSVSMRFALPGSDGTIQTRGRVVRVCRGNDGELAGMGIEFEPLSESASRAIDQLIRSLRAGRSDRVAVDS